MIKRLQDGQLLRTDFCRNYLALSSFSMLFSMSGVVMANSGEIFPPTVNLQTSGDWVIINGDGVTANILNGSDLGANLGYSVNAQSHPTATIAFSGNSTVAGTIGVQGGMVANVQGGAAGTSVTFNAQVASTQATFTGASTMTFNTTSSAAINFAGFNGTAVIAAGQTFNGAATTTTANTGILTLNGASVYNGAVGTPTFFVNQINLPTGNSTINGFVVPENVVVGPNTLKMGGALTFPAGSTLTLTASGDNTYGQILAPGEAVSLTSGLTINVNVPNTATFSGSPLQVISGAGASGNTVLVNSLNPRYSFTALNNSSDPAGHSTSNNVLLFPAIVAALPPASPAAGAGNAFNAALPGATGDLLLVQSLVSALGSLAAIAAAQEQFAPIVNGDNAMMSLQVLDSFQNRWQTNLLRARGADICYDRFDPAGCPTVCNPCSGSGRANAWNGEGFWADVFAYGADQHTRQRIEGYDAQTFGVMGAWQQRIYEHWQAGLGLGYAHTHVSGDAGQIAANHLNINTVEATAFLGYNKGPWFLDSFFTTDWNDYDGYRHIVFAGVDRVASSDYDGQGYSLLFSGGYNFYFGKVFTITPLASIQFQKLHIDGYTESGAGALDLVQESQHYNVIESGLGVMLGSGFMPIENCCSILNSEVHAIWYYDLETFLYRNTSYFSGGGPAFDTIGTRPGRSKLDLGISSTIFTARGLSLQLGYDAYFRSNYIGQEGNLSISYRI